MKSAIRSALAALIAFVGASSWFLLGARTIESGAVPPWGTLTLIVGFGCLSFSWKLFAGEPLSRERLDDSEVIALALVALVGGLAGVFLLYLASRSEDQVVKGSLTAGACLALGLAFYMFRQSQRIAYGLLEAGVGMYLAWAKAVDAPGPLVDSAGQPTFVAAVLTASVYLIVRGVDNVMVGWSARKAHAAKATALLPPKERAPLRKVRRHIAVDIRRPERRSTSPPPS